MILHLGGSLFAGKRLVFGPASPPIFARFASRASSSVGVRVSHDAAASRRSSSGVGNGASCVSREGLNVWRGNVSAVAFPRGVTRRCLYPWVHGTSSPSTSKAPRKSRMEAHSTAADLEPFSFHTRAWPAGGGGTSGTDPVSTTSFASAASSKRSSPSNSAMSVRSQLGSRSRASRRNLRRCCGDVADEGTSPDVPIASATAPTRRRARTRVESEGKVTTLVCVSAFSSDPKSISS